MSTKKTTPRGPKAVAKLPANPSQLATRAEGAANAVNADKDHFPTTVPEAAQTLSDVATLRAKILAAATRAVGSADARNVQDHVVRQDVDRLMGVVQKAADGLPYDAAAELIVSMTFSVSQSGKHRAPKPQLAVKQGSVSGTVKLVALSLGTKARYTFEYSLDQSTWTAQPLVHVANMTLTGLTSGQTYYFRFNAILGSTPLEVSQTVSFLVK